MRAPDHGAPRVREPHGCACCSGDFGQLFATNHAIRALAANHSPPAIGARVLHGVDRRAFLKSGLAAAGAIGLLPACTDPAAPAESTTVFTGGTVLTVDDAFSEAEAIAIRGNRILAVGAERDVRAVAGDGAEVVDLAGKTLLPGFIDAHTHVVSGAVVDSVMEYVGMTRFGTVAQVLDHLRALAQARDAGQWIVARNFDPAVQTGADELTFAELDAVSTEHPVFVLNASGHIAYANAMAFEVAEIPQDVENPPGAEFVRDASGKLNGVMRNNVAFMRVARANPGLAAADPTECLIELLTKWSKLGLTTVSELALGSLSSSPADVAIAHEAARSGRLRARIRSYPFYTVGTDAWDEAGVEPGAGDALVRIAGYKLVADGSNQGFTGLQREPYLNSEDRGLAYMSAEELTATALDRAQKGWQLAIHANGDAAIDHVLDACEALRDAGVDLERVRPRIEHCSILHDDQLARMKQLGVSASFLIGHVHYWGVAMRDEVFGEDKAKLLDRCRSAERAGVGFSLHSDFMVTDPNPLHMIEMAVTRRTWKEPDYVLAPDERISVESAIRAMTYEPARQLFSEHEVGSLEAGKLADLVILDKDPRAVAPDAIKDIEVVQTWMDGARVYPS